MRQAFSKSCNTRNTGLDTIKSIQSRNATVCHHAIIWKLFPSCSLARLLAARLVQAALKEELWTEKQFKLMTGWHTVSSLLCVELRHYYPVLLFRCLCYRINILKVLNLDIGSPVWHGKKICYVVCTQMSKILRPTEGF